MAYDKTFLGTGMKFPIQVDPATGRVRTSSGNESVKEAIYIILSTAQTERIARPGFGASTGRYTFMDLNFANVNMMIRDLKRTILDQEPRVDSVRIKPQADQDRGRLILTIEYTVTDSYESDSLVYPFYLNVPEELSEAEAPGFEQLETE